MAGLEILERLELLVAIIKDGIATGNSTTRRKKNASKRMKTASWCALTIFTQGVNCFQTWKALFNHSAQRRTLERKSNRKKGSERKVSKLRKKGNGYIIIIYHHIQELGQGKWGLYSKRWFPLFAVFLVIKYHFQIWQFCFFYQFAWLAVVRWTFLV